MYNSPVNKTSNTGGSSSDQTIASNGNERLSSGSVGKLENKLAKLESIVLMMEGILTGIEDHPDSRRLSSREMDQSGDPQTGSSSDFQSKTAAAQKFRSNLVEITGW